MPLADLSPEERAQYESPSDSVGPGLTRADVARMREDEEPEVEDEEIAAARARINDPQHMAAVEARNAERARSAAIGRQFQERVRDEQIGFHQEALGRSVVMSAGGGWDADDEEGWFDDDYDEARQIPPAAVQAFDQLVQSGASDEYLAEVAEESGYPEELGRIKGFRDAERQRALNAAEQRAMAHEQERQRQPYVRLNDELEKIAARDPEYGQLVRDLANLQLHHRREHGVLPESEEEALQVGQQAVWAANRLRENNSQNAFAEAFWRGSMAQSPSSFLDRQTGEIAIGPELGEVDWANLFEPPEPGPKQKGARWAAGAADVMKSEAERAQAVDNDRAAGLKRALKQQERDERLGRPGRKL